MVTITMKLDGTEGDGHDFTMTFDNGVSSANRDMVFTNYPASGKSQVWRVWITQDATGGIGANWPGEVKDPPTITETANTTSLIVFITSDGGTTVYPTLLIDADLRAVGADNLGDHTATESLKMANQNIVDCHQVQLTGATGDVVHGLLTSTATNFDISHDGTSGNIRLFCKDSVGTSKQVMELSAEGTGSNLITVNKDGSSFAVLDEIGALNFAVASGSKPSVAGIANGLTITAHDPSIIDFNIEGSSPVTKLSITGTEIDFFDNCDFGFLALTNIGSLLFGSTDTGIADLSPGLQYDVPTGESHGFRVNNVEEFRFSANLLRPNTDGGKELGDATHHWDDVFSETFTLRGTGGNTTGSARTVYADSTRMIFNMPTGDGFMFKVNNTDTLRVLASSIVLTPTSTGQFVIRNPAATKNIAISQHQTLAEAQITGTDDIRYSVGDNDSHIFKTAAGDTSISLELSGTTNTPKIGFYGTAPVAQQTVGSDTLANLYIALRASGIIG